MPKNIILSVGITILFLGLAINPAVAVNPISSDSNDDCEICPKVSNLDRITILKEVSKKYVSDLSWNFPISCGILKILANFGEKVGYGLWNFVLTLDNFPKILGHIAMSIIAIGYISLMLGWVIGCWDWIIPDWLEYA